MKIEDILDAGDNLNDNVRIATARLIDIKVEGEMKQFLADIKTEFKMLDRRFEQIETKIEHMDDKFSAQFKHIDDRFTLVFWLVGFVGIFLTLLMTIVSILPKL